MSEAQPDPIETDVLRWKRTIEGVPLKADVPFLVDAIRRDRRAGVVTRTGLPSATSGAGGGGRGKGGISDPVGETAVNRVGVERGDHDLVDDPLHNDVQAAIRLLDEAAMALGSFAQVIAGMRRKQGDTPNVQWCEACLVAGVRHPWDRFARDLRGITQPMHLCDAAYRFVDKQHRLPSVEEAAYYDLKGRWKIRIDPTASPSAAVPA